MLFKTLENFHFYKMNSPHCLIFISNKSSYKSIPKIHLYLSNRLVSTQTALSIHPACIIHYYMHQEILNSLKNIAQPDNRISRWNCIRESFTTIEQRPNSRHTLHHPSWFILGIRLSHHDCIFNPFRIIS